MISSKEKYDHDKLITIYGSTQERTNLEDDSQTINQ
jgi:hypothetical protein